MISKLYSFVCIYWREIVIIWLLALGSKILFWNFHQNFAQDQVRDYLLLRQHWLDNDYYIPLGPNTAGNTSLATLPLYYYLQFAAQVISGQQYYTMTGVIMLLESCTPVVLWFYVVYLLKFLKAKNIKLLAWLTTLIYICAPMVLIASTNNWNPNLVPLFSLLFLACANVFLFEKRNWALVGAVMSFWWLINLHFQWFVLTPLLLLVLVAAGARWRKCGAILLVTIVLCLLSATTYLHYEYHHQAVNLKQAWSLLSGETHVSERIRKPVYLMWFFPGFYTRVVSGSLFYSNWEYLYLTDWQVTLSMLTTTLCFWLIAVGSVWAVLSVCLKSRTLIQPCILPLLNLCTMAVVLRLYHGDKPDYFLYCFLPYGFILLAFAWSLLSSKFWLYVGASCLLLVEGLAVWRIPITNAKADYEKIIANLPKGDRQLVILNQNLYTPLTYFLDESQLSFELNPYKKYNILICESGQMCDKFVPNLNSPFNLYAYDLVNKKDYSVLLPAYNPIDSYVVRTKTLILHVLTQDD